MANLLQRALKSPFVRNVAVLSSGMTLAMVLPVLATPVLSRLYDPVHFGTLALFLTILAICAEAASARYELAVVLPKEDEDAANVLGLACLVVLSISVLTLVGVALAGRWLSLKLGSPELARFLWWIPVALFAVGIFRSVGHWATRHKQFPSISLAHVVRSVVLVIVQVVTGSLGAGAGGLIGGRVAGEATSMFAMGARIRDKTGILRTVSWNRMRSMAREYSDFPKFSLPQSVLNALSQGVATFLLAFFYGPGIVGIWAMAHRILVLPNRLLGQSVRQVFFQKASETKAQGRPLFPVTAQTTLGIASVVFFPVLAAVLFGPTIFGFVLGSQWIPAGHYARWMAIWLFFSYINPPSVVLTRVLRKNHYLLIYDIALFTCRCLTLIIGGPRYSPLTVVAAFCLVGAFFNAGLVVFMHVLSRRYS